MPQKKINSFFNPYGKSIKFQASDLYNANQKTSANNLSYWNIQQTKTQSALQKYHSNRKQQQQMRDRVLCSSELPTPTNSQFIANSQQTDDSQTLPSCSQFESSESINWNQRSYDTSSIAMSRNLSQSSVQLQSNCGSSLPRSETTIKKEYRNFLEAAKQEEREKYEQERLHNFLMTAKQCCEDSNEICRRIQDSQDKFVLETITKMKECLETTVPKLLETITTNNLEKQATLFGKLNELETQLKERDEQILTMEKNLLSSINNKGDDCIKEIVATINKKKELTQCSMEDLLGEIKVYFNKLKTLVSDVWSQYSPQYKSVGTSIKSSLSYPEPPTVNLYPRCQESASSSGDNGNEPLPGETWKGDFCKSSSGSPVLFNIKHVLEERSPNVAGKQLEDPDTRREMPVTEKCDDEFGDSSHCDWFGKRFKKIRKRSNRIRRQTKRNAESKIAAGCSGSAVFESTKNCLKETRNLRSRKITQSKSNPVQVENPVKRSNNEIGEQRLNWWILGASDSDETDYVFGTKTSNIKLC